MADLNYTPHFLLRLGGPYGPEKWSVGLRMEIGGVNFDHPLIPGNGDLVAIVSEAMTEVVETHAREFFMAVKSHMVQGVAWDTISCNRIGRNGKYVRAVSFERNVSPVEGMATSPWAGPDAAVGVAHLTEVRRGWANKGRVYLPINAFGLTTTAGPLWGAIPSGIRNTIGTAWAAFLSELNDLAVDLNTNIAGQAGVVVTGTRVGVFSPGTGKEQPRDQPGVWHPITGVRVGAQPDTQRRRLNKQADLWEPASPTYTVTS